MKFFDALKRQKTYIEGNSIKTHNFSIDAVAYTELEVDEQIPFIEAMFGNIDFSEHFANEIKITIRERGDVDDLMNENEIFNLFSNIITVYAKRFPKQVEKVLMPKKSLLDTLPISPMTLVLLTNIHVVNKPIQVTLKFVHPETGGEDEVTLV